MTVKNALTCNKVQQVGAAKCMNHALTCCTFLEVSAFVTEIKLIQNYSKQFSAFLNVMKRRVLALF